MALKQPDVELFFYSGSMVDNSTPSIHRLEVSGRHGAVPHFSQRFNLYHREQV